MSEQEFKVEIHGTAQRDIAGSECHRAPLIPNVAFECPGCEQTFFICSTCNKPCTVISVGTQEVKF